MNKEIGKKIEAYNGLYKHFKEQKEISENNFEESRKGKLYLARSKDDFLWATAIKNIIENPKIRLELKLPENYQNIYHWLIIVSYYSMYHAATAAIAKKKIKCESHKATIASLAKHYATEEELEFDFIEKLNYIYIEYIETGRDKRRGAQYNVEAIYTEEEAYKIFEYAQKFVKRLQGLLEKA